MKMLFTASSCIAQEWIIIVVVLSHATCKTAQDMGPSRSHVCTYRFHVYRTIQVPYRFQVPCLVLSGKEPKIINLNPAYCSVPCKHGQGQTMSEVQWQFPTLVCILTTSVTIRSELYGHIWVSFHLNLLKGPWSNLSYLKSFRHRYIPRNAFS